MRLLSSVDPLPRPVLKVAERKYEQEILMLQMSWVTSTFRDLGGIQRLLHSVIIIVVNIIMNIIHNEKEVNYHSKRSIPTSFSRLAKGYLQQYLRDYV